MRAARGMTLIELVIAMLIFAMVAIMGLQSLSGMMRQRDRAAGFADDAEALGRAAALIRGDLSAMMPVLFFAPGGRPQSAVDEWPGGNGFMLTTGAAQGYAPLGAGGLTRRVEYRFERDTGRLMRRVWGTAWPAGPGVRGPETVVMEGVAALRLRSYWQGQGWIDGLRNRRAEPAAAEPSGQDGEAFVTGESYSSALPQAVEITLVTERLGEIVLVETPL